MTPPRKKQPSKAPTNQAPSIFWGFNLQSLRATMMLLLHRDVLSVTSESVDDLYIKWPTHGLIEQITSRNSNNPCSDRAEKLWNSLRQWAALINANQIPKQSTKFRLYVVGDFDAGAIAARFHSACDEASARDALKFAFKTLTVNEKGESTPLDGKAAEFFAFGDDICATVIERFSLQIDKADQSKSLIALLKSEPVPAGYEEYVANNLVGWVFTQSNKYLSKNQPAVLDREKFKVCYTSAIQTCSSVLPTPAKQIEFDESSAFAETSDRVFVRQLLEIECEDESVRNASFHWLTAQARRAEWIENGHVTPDMLNAFEKGLRWDWKLVFDQHTDPLSTPDKKQCGRTILRKSLALKPKLGEREVDYTFVAGSLHELADSVEIGWHPDFRSIFGGHD